MYMSEVDVVTSTISLISALDFICWSYWTKLKRDSAP
jgi:hypothetical protein